MTRNLQGCGHTHTYKPKWAYALHCYNTEQVIPILKRYFLAVCNRMNRV